MDSQLPLVVGLGLANVRNASPMAFRILFPKGDFIIATANGQNVPRDRPAQIPNGVVERVQHEGNECGWIVASRRSPNDDPTILQKR